MKKRIVALVLCALVLSGCGAALPEGLDESTVASAAEEVAEQLAAGETEAIYEKLRPDVAGTLTEEDVAALVPKSAGVWEKIVTTEVRSRTDKGSGEEYALAMVVCQFEEGRVTISAAFDSEMQLIGLQVS